MKRSLAVVVLVFSGLVLSACGSTSTGHSQSYINGWNSFVAANTATSAYPNPCNTAVPSENDPCYPGYTSTSSTSWSDFATGWNDAGDVTATSDISN